MMGWQPEVTEITTGIVPTTQHPSMEPARILARHIRELYDGGNWTAVSMKEVLSGVSRQEALARQGDTHTIAELLHHIDYYASAVMGVLQGGPLEAHDRLSFDLDLPVDEGEWREKVERALQRGRHLADVVEGLDATALDGDFDDGKYGSCHRNILGLIEHTHYHLGQMAILRKLIP
jgi:hypothetical protein